MEEEQPKAKLVFTSFVDDIGIIYEQVWNEETDELCFVKYDIISGAEGVVQQVSCEEVIYKPVDNDLVKNQFILFPTAAVDYGNIEFLLAYIQKFIHKYVDLTEFGEVLSSYYVLLSWVYDNFETIPYLKFSGDYGTGKTRALKVVGSICYKPIFAGGSTTVSPIFRLIEQFRGTLIIDEADFSNSDYYAEITKILNCGYSKNMPVLRTEGDKKKEPTAFNVFCPKIVATRGSYKDLALESRCLTELMKGNPRKDIPYQLPKNFYKECLELRNMLLMFRLKHYERIELDENLRIEGVEARINQIVMPILAIIENPKERNRIREFIIEYDRSLKSRRSEDIPAIILSAIIGLYRESETLTYMKIAEKLNESRTKETGQYKISPTRIGNVNRSTLGFLTKRIDGRTQLIWNEELVKQLCNRYGMEFNLDNNSLNELDDKINEPLL
jgi:hypothetical protein